MHSQEKRYKRAIKLFGEALKIDSSNTQATYYIGLTYLLGLGVDQDIEKALLYFTKEGMEKDPRALNAAGYVYFYAPEAFSIDKNLISLFGSIK